MKIIIGDAKTQKMPRASQSPLESATPAFARKAKTLLDRLKSLSLEELEKQFKVSAKIAATLHERYRDETRAPAFELFDGMVFRQFNIDVKQESLNYYNNHLRIVSPLYGLLRPGDAISFYRLSMDDFADLDLYEYHHQVNDLLKDEDCLILLCSQEFARLIDHPEAYFVDFLEFDGNKVKRPSAHIKKARGLMVAAMANEKIASIAKLETLRVDGFAFNKELSKGKNLVFSRKFATKKTLSPANRP
ncbi:MAG: YaaA family protein [Erysipelotrichaceae bacterium]|nr:YaaA family protein [Erysipelotrichaceae bacterium]